MTTQNNNNNTFDTNANSNSNDNTHKILKTAPYTLKAVQKYRAKNNELINTKSRLRYQNLSPEQKAILLAKKREQYHANKLKKQQQLNIGNTNNTHTDITQQLTNTHIST